MLPVAVARLVLVVLRVDIVVARAHVIALILPERVMMSPVAVFKLV